MEMDNQADDWRHGSDQDEKSELPVHEFGSVKYQTIVTTTNARPNVANRKSIMGFCGWGLFTDYSGILRA